MGESAKSKFLRIFAGLIRVVLLTGLIGVPIVGFSIYAKKLAEFQNRCWSIHHWMESVFKEKQLEAYKIVQHLRIEYPLMKIIEKRIPEGDITEISFHGNYSQHTSALPSEGTDFIHDFLNDIVDSEASLFLAQFKRLPTVAEMDGILEKIPYYVFLSSLQSALFELEWQTKKFSHPDRLSGVKLEKLEEMSDAFDQDRKRFEDILAQNPSRLKMSRVHYIN